MPGNDVVREIVAASLHLDHTAFQGDSAMHFALLMPRPSEANDGHEGRPKKPAFSDAARQPSVGWRHRAQQKGWKGWAMITGAQIREGRRLASLGPRQLARRAKLPVAVVERAESVDGEPVITTAQAHALQRALEAAGVEFMSGDSPGVKLRSR